MGLNPECVNPEWVLVMVLVVLAVVSFSGLSNGFVITSNTIRKPPPGPLEPPPGPPKPLPEPTRGLATRGLVPTEKMKESYKKKALTSFKMFLHVKSVFRGSKQRKFVREGFWRV